MCSEKYKLPMHAVPWHIGHILLIWGKVKNVLTWQDSWRSGTGSVVWKTYYLLTALIILCWLSKTWGGPGLPDSAGGLPTFLLSALTLFLSAGTRQAKFPVTWQKMAGEATTGPHLHEMQQDPMLSLFPSEGSNFLLYKEERNHLCRGIGSESLVSSRWISFLVFH